LKNLKILFIHIIQSIYPFYELKGSIEIDELYLKAKRKCNLGRLPPNQDFTIVLGFFCRETREIILNHIGDKSSDSIMPLIIQSVSEYSTIYTEQNSVYVNNRRNQSKI
jgi:hypothetical protein